ncbi:MAG: hypothetical protein PWP07_1809 [Epulopiscium sp.]|jgi:hypothetical protein|uniref:Uncharacterized protein n=1 Tax=Defluviitalea raffinosedens TaxID=1450156 RepID=A0A7C8HG20_9FIRM|nr:hypothetical protein [Defluviitalea raffinosedens]MBZ4669437.1 hypothetical protein [Defluviitaleaceae bacterium]MDK2788564.1 hypothetical protein [Candidatus Epulonipiscium sp.]KAE9636909.1 hypothetical protein GND95_00310 [Defluviitalea raffinosedens]MBM7686433.1 hypothetical protein [Defluviitalea raffinosedens]HHW67219.1 hypothetical protein [Candidatus Epulonipiscium sp.]
MSSNRRRSHIHFVKQFKNETLEYTGTRIVIFLKEKGIKYIKDFDQFFIHRYYRPKNKKHSISQWKIIPCVISEVIKKVMINESMCKKYKMIHILYESTTRNIEDFLEEVLAEEKIFLSKEEIENIKEKIKNN